MNEFKHRESSSLLILLQILEYAFAQSLHESDSRIRALSILLYSSTITSDAQSRASRRLFEELFSSLSLSATSSMISSEAQSRAETKSFREINFSLSKVDRILYSFFDLKLIRTRITCFSFIDLKLIRTRITCFSFIVLKLIRTRVICFS